MMMTLSDAMMNYWYLWLAGAVSIVAGFVFGRRTTAGRHIFDWIKINCPVIGTMFRKVTISRSIRTLGTMLASGVPVIEAIKLAGAVAENYYYEVVWQKVLEKSPVENESAKCCNKPAVSQRAGADDQRGRRGRKTRLGSGKSQHILRQRSRNHAQGHYQPDRAADDRHDGRGGWNYRTGPDAADLQPQPATVKKPRLALVLRPQLIM